MKGLVRATCEHTSHHCSLASQLNITILHSVQCFDQAADAIPASIPHSLYPSCPCDYHVVKLSFEYQESWIAVIMMHVIEIRGGSQWKEEKRRVDIVGMGWYGVVRGGRPRLIDDVTADDNSKDLVDDAVIALSRPPTVYCGLLHPLSSSSAMKQTETVGGPMRPAVLSTRLRTLRG